MPEVEALHRDYAGEGVQVFAVGAGGEERLEKIRAERAPTVPVPRATEVWLAQVGVVGFPETLILDREGRVAVRLEGPESYPWFQAQVEALLAEAPSDGAPPAPRDERGRHGPVARIVYTLLHLKSR